MPAADSDSPSSPEGTSTEHGRKLSHAGESLYAILGVGKDASPEEIRKTYRKLALQSHPDKNPGDSSAADRFKEINRANAILSDPNKRAIYDQYGSMGIMLLDQLGEDNARAYMALNHPCVKCCIIFLFCATGCCCCLCCCCCCNFCCGRCAPKDEEEEEILAHLDAQNESTPPQGTTEATNPADVVITTQPGGTNGKKEKTPLVFPQTDAPPPYTSESSR